MELVDIGKQIVVNINTGVTESTTIVPPYSFHLAIFSSETGQWSYSTFNCAISSFEKMLNYPKTMAISNDTN
ncbi:hypothetical protein F8388_008193 [Cannabis sativa]|uniref:Uncharacterized protein n=1 Tax=Cannabis sativa TaxID=3483 RepID=A0A7J6H9N4_CANSA|nr:hypothetical protein F8388_008193 [Cannabis sativa]KAF4391308.1 hypothetical protein G4B88_016618 [Cannabis sativa]